MGFCLLKKEIDKFKEAINDKRISPSELNKMTSEGRREFFEGIVGKDKAGKVNALYQQKSLMKNKQKGMISWAKTVMGDTKQRAGMIDRIKKLDESQVNSGEFLDDLVEQKIGIRLTEEEFGELHKLSKEISDTKGVNTTKQLTEKLNETKGGNKIVEKLNKHIKDTAIEKEYARIDKIESRKAKSESPKEISKLQEEINTTNEKIREKNKKLNQAIKAINRNKEISAKDRTEIVELIEQMVDGQYSGGGKAYGKAKAFLEAKTEELSDIARGEKGLSATREYAKGLKGKSAMHTAGKAIVEALKTSRGAKAMADFSAAGRQAKWVLARKPSSYFKNIGKSFKAGVSGLGSGEARTMQLADIYSKDNYAKGYYDEFNIGKHEEEMINKGALEHLPGVKNIYKGSADAYDSMLQGVRVDLMDDKIIRAKKAGIELNEKNVKAMADQINTITGRGALPKGSTAEKTADALNWALFSPRKLIGDIGTPLQLLAAARKGATGEMSAKETRFLAKEAFKNTGLIAAELAVIYGAAKAFWGEDAVESDARSSDFGQIKIGNTRFDPTGGMKAPVVLAKRILSGEKKSSVSGKVTKMGEDFGSGEISDEVTNFLANRLAPVPGLGKKLIDRKQFGGEDYFKGTETEIAGRVAKDLYMPITLETAIEAYNSKDPDQADPLAISIADFLGVGANTYGLVREKDWMDDVNKETGGVEMKQLYEDAGDEKFKAINKRYNEQLLEETSKLMKSEKYKELSPKDRSKEFNHLKDNIKKQSIKDEIGKWTYKRKKSEKFKSKI